MYTKNHSGKIFLLLFLFILLQTSRSFSQSFSCGSVPSQEYVNYLLARNASFNKTTTAADPSKLATLKTISVTAWIVKDSLRNPGLSTADIDAAFKIVNADFRPMNLAFKVCDIKYIENYQYDSLDSRKPSTDKEDQLYTQFHDENRINMYFVSVIRMDPAKTGVEFPCGYAPLGDTSYIAPTGRDLIYIKKSCVASSKTISHELGHFFGLLHTHGSNTAPTTELVKRIKKNCSTTGDFLCDTDADPKGTDDATCQLTAPGLKDANGDFYTPPIGNIMSYYSDKCKCGFTKDQFSLMGDVYLKFRKYLY